MGLSDEQCTVLVLRAPGNVERVLNLIRTELFRQTGAASSQCFPPFLPLAYVEPEVDIAITEILPQTSMAPLTVGPVMATKGTLHVDTEIESGWSEMLDGITTVLCPPGLPEPCSGFFLGAQDLVCGWTAAGEPGADVLVGADRLEVCLFVI